MFETLKNSFHTHQTNRVLQKLVDSIQTGQLEDFQNKLKKFIEMDGWDEHQEFLFRMFMLYSQNRQFLRTLLHMGFDPNVKDEEGIAPLHRAVESGIPENVILLLEFDADPNVQDLRGVTPLHIAYSYDRMSEIIEALINHGANLNIRDGIGKRYLM